MQCSLKTRKGFLVIELSPHIPRLGALFTQLVEEGTYSGCTFNKVTADYICLESAKTTAEYQPESHTLVRFGKRGTVMLLPDLALVITLGTETPLAVEGSIIGYLKPESVFVAEEIACGESIDSKLKFPVAIEPVEQRLKLDGRSPAASETCNVPKPPKKRIRMFEQARQVRRFKPNPNIQQHDKLFERVKAFEASLG